MLSTFVPSPTVSPEIKACLHLVTLIHRLTGHELVLSIETESDRFVDVWREVAFQKAERKLVGYEIYEVLDCDQIPF